jgi:hypothetical protein
MHFLFLEGSFVKHVLLYIYDRKQFETDYDKHANDVSFNHLHSCDVT